MAVILRSIREGVSGGASQDMSECAQMTAASTIRGSQNQHWDCGPPSGSRHSAIPAAVEEVKKADKQAPSDTLEGLNSHAEGFLMSPQQPVGDRAHTIMCWVQSLRMDTRSYSHNTRACYYVSWQDQTWALTANTSSRMHLVSSG